MKEQKNKVFRDGTLTIVATSHEHALEIAVRVYGDADPPFEEVPETEEIKIRYECGADVPKGMLSYCSPEVKAEARAWARFCEPGIIGSTEW